MKKRPFMTRMSKGAPDFKLLSIFLAASFTLAPVAQAQTSQAAAGDSEASQESKSAAANEVNTLTFTDSEGRSNSKTVASGSETSLEGKPAEESSAEAGTSDGTALADSSGAATTKRTDPLYRYSARPPGFSNNMMPTTTGAGQIRKAFKLVAKDELIHNLSFRDAPVKSVIAELAGKGNLNILLDKSVVGKVTGDLRDVTINEAMDSILASAGLQSRVLDSNTVIVGSPNSLGLLGLNRTHYKVFKMSYANPFDIQQLLYTSVFNRGFIPDFTAVLSGRFSQLSMDNPKKQTQSSQESQSAMGGETQRRGDEKEQSTTLSEEKEESGAGGEYSFSSRLDGARTIQGTTRIQTQEGTGFNNAGQDPGTQNIRAFQEISTTANIEQNGGGAIVIPDARNRQLIVVGTPDDLAVAEECIRLLDRRPRQVHVQVSLVELQNTGIRQLGASLNLQGQGASGALLGGSGAPLINMLPGFGSGGGSTATTWTSQNVTTQGLIGGGGKTGVGSQLAPGLLPQGSPNPLLGTFSVSQVGTIPAATAAISPTSNYNGILGGFFPGPVAPTIAGVAATASALSNLNFLSLSKAAGGRTNIATMPYGLNFSLNLILQQQKGKVLANPSVVVSDNTEALITLASEVIHKVTSTVSLGVTNVNVELTQAGIFLDVLPKCSEDGFIYMRIRPQVSSPTGPPQTFANQQVIVTLLNIRQIMAQEIRVKNGQTLVLGGLFTEQEAAQISKVPYLAETPIFGALFRNTLKGRSRTELMLMITPKIIEDSPLDATPLADGFGSGARM